MQIEFAPDRGDHHETAVRFGEGAVTHEIYYRSGDIQLTPRCEAFAAPALISCMRQGWNLELDDPVSPRFASGLESIQRIFRNWNPALHYIEIDHTLAAPSQTEASGVGCFFTAGLDSFYTFLKHRDEITDLIFVHGFDIPLEEHALRDMVSKRLREIADAFGKRLIEVETNLRQSFLSPFTKWGREAHGAALASVAHQLSSRLRKTYIASSCAYQDLFPWGTHPALDPHWSTESLEFVHDGCEANRLIKAELVSSSAVALQHLRVCFENPGGHYNCGRCEKCIRTMIELSTVGALERCSAFAEPLANERVGKILGGDEHHRAFYVANLHALERYGGDPGLIDALNTILERPRWKERLLVWVDRRKRRLAKRFGPGRLRRRRRQRRLQRRGGAAHGDRIHEQVEIPLPDDHAGDDHRHRIADREPQPTRLAGGSPRHRLVRGCERPARDDHVSQRHPHQ